MEYLFTEEDFSSLNDEITSLRERIKKAAKEVGLSCQQSSETFHDNFGYEQAERDQRMWSSHLRELIKVRNHAKIFYPGPSRGKVSIGRTVKVRDLNSHEEKIFRVGSFMILSPSTDENEIPTFSYDAPLPKALLGAGEGDYREAFFADKWHHFVVLKVE